jgi:hypothetical protein
MSVPDAKTWRLRDCGLPTGGKSLRMWPLPVAPFEGVLRRRGRKDRCHVKVELGNVSWMDSSFATVSSYFTVRAPVPKLDFCLLYSKARRLRPSQVSRRSWAVEVLEHVSLGFHV